MSLITDDPEESPRDCSRSRKHHHHDNHHGGSSRRRALIAVSSTIASLLSLAFILWLTLRPTSPHFSLLAGTATANTNASAGIIVDAAFTAHNPNAHAAALYDRLQASASYGSAASPGAGAPLPPLAQPEASDVVVSALMTSPAAVAVGGRALLRMRLEGQLRWKVGAWVSGRHGLAVDCIAAVVLQPSASPRVAVGVVQGSSSQCATHVL